MIRVNKAETIPASLQGTPPTHYDGQDVQDRLVLDHHGKCYICEQETRKSFQIEHHIAQTVDENLRYSWTNLFLSCPFCNGRKSGGYDLLHPTMFDIEEMISHRINLGTNLVEFAGEAAGVQVTSTIELLQKLFNGKNNIRDVKTNILYRDLQREMVFFLGLLSDFLTDGNHLNRQKVSDSLLITKEFLAFKYWIIKDNPTLFEHFKDEVLWNKPNL